MVWARGSSQSYSQIKKGKGGYINMANGGAGALSYDQTGKYERAIAGTYGTEHSKGGAVQWAHSAPSPVPPQGFYISPYWPKRGVS